MTFFMTMNLLLQKEMYMKLFATENGRVIIDFGDKMFGWVRPDNFEFFEVGHELDYEYSTIPLTIAKLD